MQIRHTGPVDKPARDAPHASPIRCELTGSDSARGAGITARGTTPVLALCRQLLAAGFKPNEAMEVFRGATLALHIRSIGEAAGLEINSEGTGFRPARRPDAAPPVRFDEEKASAVARGESGPPEGRTMIGSLYLEVRDRPALKELVAAMAKLSRRQRDEIARLDRRAKAAKAPRLRRLAREAKAEVKRLAALPPPFYRDGGGRDGK